MIIGHSEMITVFTSILLNKGFELEKAQLIANTFANSTFDGILSHGVNRFSLFIEYVDSGVVDPHAAPQLAFDQGVFERYDGNKGPGILNAHFCIDRAIDLSRSFGMSCVGLYNTNHWMRGGTYGWKAAEAGCISICFTNTKPNMPPWGGIDTRIGNNPIVVSIPKSDSQHLVLDMSMSMFSYGKLNEYKINADQLPFHGGYNAEGELTTDPAAILKSERVLPAAFWKGSGLSIMLDLVAGILSKGNTTSEIGKLDTESALSQVFICFDVSKLSSTLWADEIIENTMDFMKSSRLAENESIFYPGERTLKNRIKNLENGVEVNDNIWKEIIKLYEA
ncbi:MAG: 3-dehydro-L-gulonate 2-dehydrogenase [Cyclobacteriaceae bacterium]